uniref:Solute carrier family 66 member 2 n=1 Tax=Cacopsylla melanoneura TaxID=428564 RepID=A0A8D9BJQ4_9HEMI
MDVSNEFGEITLAKVVKWVCATVMIFGGVVPYIPQYWEIYTKEDASGFSMYVCLALLVANTLRILFWFGKRYELPLLVQSIIMNIVMLAMIHLCVRVRNKTNLLSMRAQDKYFTEDTVSTFSYDLLDNVTTSNVTNVTLLDFDWRFFWQWTDFQSYVDFLLALSISLSLLTFLCINSTVFIECLGFLAVFTEAMLGVPQLLKNYSQESTEGMSILMVLMWTTGDAFKTVYFVVREAPLQFWVCGSLQVLIDLAILFQVYWYKGNGLTARNDRID